MVKSGFFNSLKDSAGKADRTYGAADFSEIFKGIITDGVYEHVGDCFKVVKHSSDHNKVIVKGGRCWLNGCWMYNDSDMEIDLPTGGSGAVAPPYYWWTAIYIEVDKTVGGRTVSIKSKGSEPSPIKENAEKVTLTSTDEIFRYKIADVFNYQGMEGSDSDETYPIIDYKVGMDELPYVSCPLDSISIQDHFELWEVEFENMEEQHKLEFQNDLDQIMLDWDEWFNTAKTTLDADVAGNILNLITQLQNRVRVDEGNIDKNTADITTANSNITTALKRTGGITLALKTQDDYEAMSFHDPLTLYIIVEKYPTQYSQYNSATGLYSGLDYIGGGYVTPGPATPVE